jgi:hypothetical protein
MVTKRRERAPVLGEKVGLKTVRIEVACTPEFKARCEAEAESEGRALGAWARRQLALALTSKSDGGDV